MKTLLKGSFSTPEFEYLQNNLWIFTEKVDGTNIRVMYKDGEIQFGGKTEKAIIQPDLAEKLNEIFLPKKEIFAEVFKDSEACLYGEGYGPRIQKVGPKYRSDQSFVLFDIKIGHWWFKRKDVEMVGEKLGIDVTPIIGEGNLMEMVEMARKGFNSTWGDFLAEGIVARPKVDLSMRNGKRIITKIKHNDFL